MAKRLSGMHTLTAGHRGFNIPHVASALEMEATHFLTFDGNPSGFHHEVLEEHEVRDFRKTGAGD